MSREWKPGDVGTFRNGMPALRMATGWAHYDGSVGGLHQDDTSFLRPLVVIDPEDREQVERLLTSLSARGWEVGEAESHDDMAIALHEFANPAPPKPAEPTGLGAVVEDADGAKWILVYDHSMWQRHDNRAVWRYFSEIDAVRVLSEGVTQ